MSCVPDLHSTNSYAILQNQSKYLHTIPKAPWLRQYLIGKTIIYWAYAYNIQSTDELKQLQKTVNTSQKNTKCQIKINTK